MHTGDLVKTIKIYSVGRTENHKLVSVIIPEGYRRYIVDAHPKEFIGVKLHQNVFLTELDKYIGIVCTVHTHTQKI